MKSILVILFLAFLVFFSSSSNVQIIEFYEPGDYVITPSDYGNSNNIVVEIWGAGSGGSVFATFDINKCGYWRCYYDIEYMGGISGSYIKANVITRGNTFYFTIGTGGNNGCESYTHSTSPPYNCIGKNGGDTIFTNDADLTLNAAGGDNCHCNSYSCQNTTNDTVITFGTIIAYETGTCGSIGINEYANGAVSANGLVGNGQTVGYGAYCCGSPLGKGSDGAVVIYYVANYTPSPTISYSSSISTSTTPSSTPSVTPRASFSPTSSVSNNDKINFDLNDYITILILGGLIGLLFCFGIFYMVYRYKNAKK